MCGVRDPPVACESVSLFTSSKFCLLPEMSKQEVTAVVEGRRE